MPYDIQALQDKRDWLATLAGEGPSGLSTEQLEALVTAFSRLTAPEEPELTIGYITINTLSSAGSNSRKPGNLVLNWRKLFDVVPDTLLAGIGAATASPAVLPWAIPLAALYIWNKVWQGAEVPLTEVEACVLLALWKGRAGNNKISESDGEIRTNNLRESQGEIALSHAEYAQALTHLARLNCLELNNGVVWLREWIKVKY